MRQVIVLMSAVALLALVGSATASGWGPDCNHYLSLPSGTMSGSPWITDCNAACAWDSSGSNYKQWYSRAYHPEIGWATDGNFRCQDPDCKCSAECAHESWARMCHARCEEKPAEQPAPPSVEPPPPQVQQQPPPPPEHKQAPEGE